MDFMGILSDTRWIVMAFSAFFSEFNPPLLSVTHNLAR